MGKIKISEKLYILISTLKLLLFIILNYFMHDKKKPIKHTWNVKMSIRLAFLIAKAYIQIAQKWNYFKSETPNLKQVE